MYLIVISYSMTCIYRTTFGGVPQIKHMCSLNSPIQTTEQWGASPLPMWITQWPTEIMLFAFTTCIFTVSFSTNSVTMTIVLPLQRLSAAQGVTAVDQTRYPWITSQTPYPLGHLSPSHTFGAIWPTDMTFGIHLCTSPQGALNDPGDGDFDQRSISYVTCF